MKKMDWIKKLFASGEFPEPPEARPAPEKPRRNGANRITIKVDTTRNAPEREQKVVPIKSAYIKQVEENLYNFADALNNGPITQERKRIRDLKHQGMLLQ